MFTLKGRFHRHKDLENAILELSQDVSTMRLTLAKVVAKIAVSARDSKKVSKVDAELKSIEDQLDGKAVAWKDVAGVLHFPGEGVEEDA